VPIIAKAPVELSQRARWLERLWEALMEDAIPYIERLGDYWGELCAGERLASSWADNLIDGLRNSWEERDTARRSFFEGTSVCLSSLLAAGRYQESLGPGRKSAFRLVGIPLLGVSRAGGDGQNG
jgi:hypothetical protein